MQNRPEMPYESKIYSFQVIFRHFFGIFECHSDIRLEIFEKIFGWKLAQNVPNRPEMPYKSKIFVWHFRPFWHILSQFPAKKIFKNL